MTLPLVSVAIPAYNHASFIEACLASVYEQTYPEIELVVVDDGSTDGTYEVAEHFLALHGRRFRRIELLRQANRGVCAASNAAIEASRGEWVHLLGSDDLIHPRKVARIQQAINEWGCPDLALVHADIDMIDASGNPLEGNRLHKSRPAPGIDRDAWRWLFWNRQYVFNPTVALRREAVVAIGGFDSRLPLEDLDCWLRLALHYPIARVPEVLASYRKHTGNASRRKLIMLGALLRTYGFFLEATASRFTSSEIRRHFQMNLRQVFRRTLKICPARLPTVMQAWAKSWLCSPKPADYHHLADLIAWIADQVHLDETSG
jgi:alpha-1,3-rhamnosyltransferase